MKLYLWKTVRVNLERVARCSKVKFSGVIKIMMIMEPIYHYVYIHKKINRKMTKQPTELNINNICNQQNNMAYLYFMSSSLIKNSSK